MAEPNFEKELKRMERNGVITRAQFLQLMAVAGAFLMLGTDKAYAAKSDAPYLCSFSVNQPNFAVETLTPGPIVEARVMLFRYCPFSAEGLAFTMASISASKFS